MYGKFIKNTAGYEINSLDMKTSWEYIYENGDILLKMDQYGPVYAQANPPGDIMLFKREQHQKYSMWQMFIHNNNEEYSVFLRPNNLTVEHDEVKNYKIEFLPELARYSFDYKGIRCITEYFIPSKGTTVICKCRVKSISESVSDVEVYSHVIPYLNDAVIAPWDKYDWYLDTKFKKEKYVVFKTELLSAEINSDKRRSAHFIASSDMMDGYEVSLERYIGNGDVNHPQYVYTDADRIYGYAPVYALKYKFKLEKNEEKCFTQVLTLGAAEPAEKFVDDDFYMQQIEERNKEFEKLFSINRIKTTDEEFDYYANYWIPLQMKWVSALDRGWPTGMRGSRDSAQDFAALLYIDPKSCKNIILTMLECQRSDGWFPRQYSAKGKYGKHDLRTHIDGGVFFVEFVWKYLAHTHDYEILENQIEWLDLQETSSVLEHIKKTVEFYINDENIGEHGLCKIYGGDWLDAVNGAGIEGRGESVTVSAQTVMALKYLSDILKRIVGEDDTSYYDDCARRLKEFINKYAYNCDGYYNGVYNDAGNWIFSEKDPDGERRIYGVSNYYAIISGTTDEKKTESVLNAVEGLKSDKGYRLFSPYLGEKPISNVGRIASGDVPPYLGENGNVYNHGSQGFFARALSVADKGEELYDVIKWLLPYDTNKHPTEKTFTPPYAIVNCWQQLPGYDHRGLMCFLTGSVAMAMRGVYEWMIGIQPCLDGVEISPCIPDFMKQIEVNFTLYEKQYNLKIDNGDIFVNGTKLTAKRENMITGKTVYFLSADVLKEI